MTKLSDELLARLERLASSEGLDLVAVDVAGSGRQATLRLTIDRPQGAVSLADCETVSRQASVLLDAFDPFSTRYTLEVSSPGFDRKLTRDKDFERFAGNAVRVRMRPTWPAPRVIEGILEGRSDGLLRLRDASGRLCEFPAIEVFETRLVPEPVHEDRGPRRRGRK